MEYKILFVFEIKTKIENDKCYYNNYLFFTKIFIL